MNHSLLRKDNNRLFTFSLRHVTIALHTLMWNVYLQVSLQLFHMNVLFNSPCSVIPIIHPFIDSLIGLKVWTVSGTMLGPRYVRKN